MILFSADSSLGMMIKMVKSWLKFKLEVPSSFIALIPKTFKRPIGVKVNDCANACTKVPIVGIVGVHVDD